MSALAGRSPDRVSRSVWLLAAGVAGMGGVTGLIDAFVSSGETGSLFGLPRLLQVPYGLILLLGAAASLWPLRRWLIAAGMSLSGLAIAAVLAFTTPDSIAWLTLALIGAALVVQIPSLRGKWIVGGLASLGVGVSLIVLASGGVLPLLEFPASDRRAAPTLGAALLALGISLLARAWRESERTSLHAPPWFGLMCALLLASICVTFFAGMRSLGRTTILGQAVLREYAIGAVLEESFEGLLRSLEQASSRWRTGGGEPPAEWAEYVRTLLAKDETLLAVEWVDRANQVRAAEPLRMDLVTLSQVLAADPRRSEAVADAVLTGRINVVAPVQLLGGGWAAAICVPIGAAPAAAAAIYTIDLAPFIERRVGFLDDGHALEVFAGTELILERQSEPGPDLRTNGVQMAIYSTPWTFKAAPLPSTIAAQRSVLPILLLTVSLVGAALVGSTVFFAQASERREAAAQRTRAQLEQLLEAARHVAVIATDPSGVISVFNHGAEHLTGWDAREVLGRRTPDSFIELEELWFPTTPAGKVGQAVERFGALLERLGDSRLSDWTWVRKNGQRRRVSLSATTLRDIDGSTLGYLFVAVDVSEREEAMRELVEAKRTAEYANAAKSTFLANISHEIRTPMASIIGYADLMLDPTTLPEERVEFVATIRRNGEHLLGIINDLLDLSKIEAGRMEIEAIEVEVVEIAREVVRLLQVRAKEKGLQLTLEAEDDGAQVLVLADPLRMRQILLNLVGNAIKFTDRGWVRVGIRTQVDGDRLQVWLDVADSGLGLAPEHVARLFQNFSQADSSTTRRFGGTGLGLAISQRLAQMMGGGVEVRSRPGEGSTFTVAIVLPLARGTPRAETVAPPPSEPAAVSLAGRSVLIVEDGEDNRQLLSTILTRAGAEVTTAANGREGLDCVIRAGAASRSFDTILMDIQMAEIDGYNASRRLRNIGYRGRIIAITGNATSGDRDRAMESGCDAYAAKPIPRDVLLSLCSAAADHSTDEAASAGATGRHSPGNDGGRAAI